MSCRECEAGVVPFVWESNSKPDDAIGAEDLCFAMCLCEDGQKMRAYRNGMDERSDFALWQLWAAREQVDPARVFRLEDVFPADVLARAGFNRANVTTMTPNAIADAMRTQRGRL